MTDETMEVRVQTIEAMEAVLNHIGKLLGVASGDVPALIGRVEALTTENSRLERNLKEETVIVDRIWALFGSPSYEELNGRSIYDLISAQSAEVQRLSRLKLTDRQATRYFLELPIVKQHRILEVIQTHLAPVSGSQPDVTKGFMSREEVIRENQLAFGKAHPDDSRREPCKDCPGKDSLMCCRHKSARLTAESGQVQP